eukprot:scaffold8882_cov51-Attheya_sp.AAC.3
MLVRYTLVIVIISESLKQNPKDTTDLECHQCNLKLVAAGFVAYSASPSLLRHPSDDDSDTPTPVPDTVTPEAQTTTTTTRTTVH